MKKLHLCAAAVVASALAACATDTQIYNWGDYEAKLYDYSKKPDLRENYRTSLIETIEDGAATNRVAPGLNAELGYLYLEDGDVETAIMYFEEEQRLFPESAYFLKSVISRTQGIEPVSTPQPAPANAEESTS